MNDKRCSLRCGAAGRSRAGLTRFVVARFVVARFVVARFVVSWAALTWAALSAPPAEAKPSKGRFEVQAAAGLVIDHATKLTWERNVTLGSYGWAAAKGYCAGLSLAGGGWRLPTLTELEGLVDRRTSNPAIDPTAFANTPALAFWTSTAYVGTPDNAWRVSFDDGHSATGKTSEALRVRCVR